jgi:hypothetical protein
MGAQTLEKETFELPTVNPWRRLPTPPSREQVRFAIDLCRSELPYAERVATVRSLSVLDSQAISELIDRLKDVRAKRLARLRRSRRRRR